MDRIPQKLPFSKRRLRPRIVISYIVDYVILIGCVVGFYILDAIEPYHQVFSLQNLSLQYPYVEHEHVTIGQALVVSGLIPLVLIAVYTLFIDGLFSHHKHSDPVSGKRKLTGPYRWKGRLWELNCGVLGLLLSQGLAFIVTQVLKNACGKPRPDFIDRCQPVAGSHDAAVFGLSNSTICRPVSHAILKDGFRSWPSGHSSSSFAGLFYLALWLCGKLHFMDNRGEVWKAILVMFPILVATLIAVSRIIDYRHHPFDVISGGLLGTVCAIVSYHQYFPPITEAWKKGRAFPIRSWGSEPVPPPATMPARFLNESQSTEPLRHPPDRELLQPVGGTTPALRVPSSDREDPDADVETDPARLDSVYTPQPVNPFASSSSIYQRRSHDRDGDWSSSEDDVTDGYAMQHGGGRGYHTRTTQNVPLTGQLPTYEPYHSRTQTQTLPPVRGAGVFQTPSDSLGAHGDERGRSISPVPARGV